MNNQQRNKIVILGKGHVGYRLKTKLIDNHFEVVSYSMNEFLEQKEERSLAEKVSAFIESLDPSTISMIYLIDDKDETNLQLIILIISLFPELRVTASLFNENLIPHLESHKRNLVIINPAKIAAPVFVDCLTKEINREVKAVANTYTGTRKRFKPSLILNMILLFTIMLIAASMFFHYHESLSWIDSIYFVVVTASTVGYGDIHLGESGALGKAVVVALILSSMTMVWLIFSLVIDVFFKRRIQLALGRRKYRMKNHIVMCGLGRLGYFIVERLLAMNEKVIIIEQNEDGLHIEHFKQLGAEVYIGDGRQSKVLDDVNIRQAKALISVISNDSINLEIGLNARTFEPNIRLILRIYEEQMAEKIKEFLNIHLTVSASTIVEEKLFNMLVDHQRE